MILADRLTRADALERQDLVAHLADTRVVRQGRRYALELTDELDRRTLDRVKALAESSPGPQGLRSRF